MPTIKSSVSRCQSIIVYDFILRYTRSRVEIRKFVWSKSNTPLGSIKYTKIFLYKHFQLKKSVIYFFTPLPFVSHFPFPLTCPQQTHHTWLPFVSYFKNNTTVTTAQGGKQKISILLDISHTAIKISCHKNPKIQHDFEKTIILQEKKNVDLMISKIKCPQ